MGSSGPTPPLSLKVDVDTHDGMRHGVPGLLDVLARRGLCATFCLSFGPDNAGKAVFRAFREPAFLKKMLRTGAPRLYGWRTVLSGTLLPPRPIATAFPDLVRRVAAEGHEVIVHAWDHRLWQDHLPEMDEGAIREELERAFDAYETILGRRPAAVAAPGWQATPTSLEIEDRLGLLYASDLRDGPPCLLEAAGRRFRTLQIPTTGPCLEELLATGIRDEASLVQALLEPLRGAKQPVLALHAEVEGGPFMPFLERLLSRLLEGHPEVISLETAARRLLAAPELIPRRRLSAAAIRGRAGLVASSE